MNQRIIDKFKNNVQLEYCNEFAAEWLDTIGKESVDDMLEALRRITLDCERRGDPKGAFIHYFALYGIMQARAARADRGRK